MPVYNRAATLPGTVESVIGQSFTGWELIAVDDGSDDHTVDTLRGYGDSRIHVIRLHHTGNIARVRNAGLRAARCRYIAHLDSDDIWEEEKLQVQLACFHDHRKVSVSLTGGVQFGEAADPMPSHPTYTGPLYKKLVFDEQYYLLTSSLMVDSEATTAPRGFNERWASVAEVDYLFRAAFKSIGAYVGEPLVRYRKHQGNFHRTVQHSTVVAEMIEMYDAMAEDHLLSSASCRLLSGRLIARYSGR